jgi:DNA helicase-2/ATP-dependent DNA helicase PcrA
MMTMHSAKGLEFPHVFLVGFEDGLFPGMRAIGDAEEMEEERRLCYVAITRAKETLTISHAKQRMLYGRTNASLPSRFLREIPEEIVQKKGGYRFAQESHSAFSDSDYGYSQRGYQPRSTAYEMVQKERVKHASSYSTVAAPQKASYLELNKGDMVEHAAFGKGMVLSVMKMGGDALLEIAFDQIGTKKLMAKTASAHMKKM